jgi:hypothetical protein
VASRRTTPPRRTDALAAAPWPGARHRQASSLPGWTAQPAAQWRTTCGAPVPVQRNSVFLSPLIVLLWLRPNSAWLVLAGGIAGTVLFHLSR